MALLLAIVGKVLVGIVVALLFLVFAVVVSHFIGKQENNFLHPDPDDGVIKILVLKVIRGFLMAASLLCVPISLTWAGVGTISFWVVTILSTIFLLLLGAVVCLTAQAAAASTENILPVNIDFNQ
ncbi:hypothetical protein A2V49_00375 [candidate division WWE3 bacterium RBG_19FT_COMBO_34_6]|uniref:Uncharacterized protein n=1 Tax=candidate division WWE3 bacterium RBG_19FT_COMBO_34_6 TaxID=1802612 RepID=A0A1F4UMU8_UNCKA|nr:MAG: hypothetical protein A2V49_00375 [candidate division WWE3 bacterium RBG_19FT_COMBO_34_6]